MKNNDAIIFLQNKYRKLRICVIIMLLLLTAALACVFFYRIAAFILLFIALSYYLLFLKKKQQFYSDAVTEANLSNTICPILKTADVHRKDGNLIFAQTLKQAGLMPVKESKGSPLLCFGISGTVDDLAVSVCDATIAQDFSLREKGRKRVHFNAGAWVHIDLPDNTHQRWCLLDETSVPTPIRMDYFSHKMNMRTAPVGNDIIGKRCVLYQPAEAKQPLQSKVLHEIQKLIAYTPGYLAISVNGDSVDFFIRGRFLSRPVSLSKAPTNDLIQFDPFPELSYLIKIARAI